MDHPIDIYCDSTAALATAAGENPHKLSKHLDMELHFICERVEQKITKLRWISTDLNVVDLTKSLPVNTFRKHSLVLGLDPITMTLKKMR